LWQIFIFYLLIDSFKFYLDVSLYFWMIFYRNFVWNWYWYECILTYELSLFNCNFWLLYSSCAFNNVLSPILNFHSKFFNINSLFPWLFSIQRTIYDAYDCIRLWLKLSLQSGKLKWSILRSLKEKLSFFVSIIVNLQCFLFLKESLIIVKIENKRPWRQL